MVMEECRREVIFCMALCDAHAPNLEEERPGEALRAGE
ncbi:hypothetical protein RSAG8_08130, partial [Rhizoctonia solani AG-8 WAC10335]